MRGWASRLTLKLRQCLANSMCDAGCGLRRNWLSKKSRFTNASLCSCNSSLAVKSGRRLTVW
ncbi:MAG: hypothetical protein CM1200mP34_5670 [Verrucomicrobiales bacterium]|nr:MAG: hypothetical protein CM1200mP34_5670 [Verrucomicrobiales bacterium]